MRKGGGFFLASTVVLCSSSLQRDKILIYNNNNRLGVSFIHALGFLKNKYPVTESDIIPRTVPEASFWWECGISLQEGAHVQICTRTPRYARIHARPSDSNSRHRTTGDRLGALTRLTVWQPYGQGGQQVAKTFR